MRKILLFTISLLAAGCMAAAEVTQSHFPTSSALESGHWVRIGIPESGIYEIPYSTLERLGFEHPEAVALAGENGGKQMDLQFLDARTKTIVTEARPVELPVWHENGKMYFYAQGPENIQFLTNDELNASYPTGGAFTRKSYNQYSREGYYLLTDALTPLIIEQSKTSNPMMEVDTGVDYTYHETDKALNTTRSGNIFWGETLTVDSPALTWDINMPGLNVRVPGVMQCQTYYNNLASNGRMEYGTENDMLQASIPQTIPYNYSPIENTTGAVTFKGEQDRIRVNMNFSNPYVAAEAYLDWWVVTWQKSLPSLITETQSRILLPDVKRGTIYSLILPKNSETFRVWDISNPKQPVDWQVTERQAVIKSGTACPSLIFFDSARVQKSPTSYQTLENSNLHSRVAQGAEMLIITTRAMREYAGQIADAHKEADGIDVLVATVDEIYNEFSSCLPDPMAYKWLIKMLKLYSGERLKNVMLFGPMTSDLRGMDVEKDYEEWIIAYQNDVLPRSTGATNPNDFLVMLDDYTDKAIATRKMALGLGLLPVRNSVEAQIAADKIKRYLAIDDFEYVLNRIMWMACPGDNHMSEISARTAEESFNNYTDRTFIISPIVIDDYQSVDAGREKYFNSMRSGNLFNIYFGHGSPSGLSKSYNLLSPTHLSSLTNERLCFSIFAGCSISNFDREESGIGEKMVINARDGLIGGLIATRETYNNENRSFVETFMKAWVYEDDTNTSYRHTPLTIGELYARFKNRTVAANKHAYHLMCDPALTVPMPTHRLHIEKTGINATAGDVLEISGYVVAPDGEKDKSFNGNLSARLLAQSVSRESSGKIVRSTDKFLYTIADETLNISQATVNDGTFKLKIKVPAAVATMPRATIALAAYDKETHTGAIAREFVNITATDGTPATTDVTAPAIDAIDYNPQSHTIEIMASDETCLNLTLTGLNAGIDFRLGDLAFNSEYMYLTDVTQQGRQAKFVVKLPMLPDGEYPVYVSVADLDGNRAKRAHTILLPGSERGEAPEILGNTPAGIVFSCSEAIEAFAPRFGTEESPAKIMLTIVDKERNPIASYEILDDEFIWDFSTLTNQKAAKGLYGAYFSCGTMTTPMRRFSVIF